SGWFSTKFVESGATPVPGAGVAFGPRDSGVEACRGTMRPSPTSNRRTSRLMADSLVTLYQAEWCPFSSAVREVLTELGIDAVIRQVEPWPEQRERLRELAGTDQIPVLQTEDGRILRGTREIFAHLREREPWRFAAAHRRRFADHRDARESAAPAKLLEYCRDAGERESREPREAPAGDATVVNVPEAHRYE